MKKTIHGCTCKEEWSFTPDGKKYKGCVIGGPDNALCPLTDDPKKVKESCKGSSHARPYCAVKEKNCGWINKRDSGLQKGQGIDWCDWSPYTFGEARNAPPLIYNTRRYYLGLAIYIILYTVCIPWILYKVNKLYLMTAVLPNYHLFAEALSFHKGVGAGVSPSIFSFLTINEVSPNACSLISDKILDLCSLLGLMYIVTTNSLKKGVLYGILFGIIILIVTHILGGFVISRVCSILYYKVFTYMRTHWSDSRRTLISAMGGGIVAIFLIVMEAHLLKYLDTSKDLLKIIKKYGNYFN